MLKRKPITGTAADPTMEFAQLEINGQTYHLAYDFYAIARAEQAINGLRSPGEEKCNLLHGFSAFLVDAIAERNSALDARQTLGLLYGAMLPARSQTTLREAASLVRIETFAAIHEAIITAYGLSMKGAKKDADPLKGAAAAPASD